MNVYVFGSYCLLATRRLNLALLNLGRSDLSNVHFTQRRLKAAEVACTGRNLLKTSMWI